MSNWNTPHTPGPNEKPYVAPFAGRDWPKTPVCRWDTTLEVGFMHLLGGDVRTVRMARNTLAALYSSTEKAAQKFRSQITLGPDELPGIAHPGGVAYWRSVANDLEALAAEHWDHARGMPHARADGSTTWAKVQRLDIFG